MDGITVADKVVNYDSKITALKAPFNLGGWYKEEWRTEKRFVSAYFRVQMEEKLKGTFPLFVLQYIRGTLNSV